MKIAIPLAGEKLSMHFGHCERFALLDVEPRTGELLGREDIESPPHQPGLLPPWLAKRGAELVIAGGMGQKARTLFAVHGIPVVVGAPPDTPENVVKAYLAGTLQLSGNACDH